MPHHRQNAFLFALISLTLTAGGLGWRPAAAQSNSPIFLPTISNGLAGPEIAGCPLFPVDNILNTPIDQLPLDPHSADYIRSIGGDIHLHPDFGTLWDGAPIGIPFATVSAGQNMVDVSFDYADESDAGPYPIPPDAPIEGGPSSNGDRHVIVIDKSNCTLYELYGAQPQGDGSWTAGSGAIFYLESNMLRTETWASADAAGLPIFPGLVRYDEVAAGEIRHAIRFTASETQMNYLWPARHYASSITNPGIPPMGQRFRLKASVDLSSFSPAVRVILKAMQIYGLILADNGSDWYISGAPDSRWIDDTLVSELRRIRGSDFEAVDASSLMIDSNSGQVHP